MKNTEVAIQEITPTEEVVMFVEKLKDLKPRTKQDAIAQIHLLSAIGSAKKKMKENAYAYLDNRCAEGCTEHEADNGLKVKRITNEMKKYKQTKEVKEAEKDFEAAKIALQEAKDRAGFTLEEGASYWKAVR